MNISVILPTHNPHPTRLRRTLEGLAAQDHPNDLWECVVIDNASQPALSAECLEPLAGRRARLVNESRVGLTSARLCGFGQAQEPVIVMVDDDNVLAPNYLSAVAELFEAEPRIGAVGGRSIPEFECAPPKWMLEFYGLLALRDLGDVPLRATWRDTNAREYPTCAPIGAGMALRRTCAAAYATALQQQPHRRAYDRTGKQLTSGGDNDLVMTVLEQGYDVAYAPQLRLTHLIPAARCDHTYLGRLNRSIARSWIRVLAQHGIRPWPAMAQRGLATRRWRAWLRFRAWTGPAAWIRWQGACGSFEGRADLASIP